jgi:alkylated DNA repair dioxygenase AlkB
MYPDFLSNNEQSNLFNYIDKLKWNILDENKRYIQSYKYSNTIPSKLKCYIELLIQYKFLDKHPDQIMINKYFPEQGIQIPADNNNISEQILIIVLGSPLVVIFTKDGNSIEIPFISGALVSLREDAIYKYNRTILDRKYDIYKVPGMPEQKWSRNITILLNFRIAKSI